MNTGFAELLLWFEVRRSTGRFFLNDSLKASELFLYEGRVIHARTRNESGMEAFIEILLKWDTPGMISWEQNLTPPHQTISLDSEATLVIIARYFHQMGINTKDNSRTSLFQRPKIEKDRELVYTITIDSPDLGKFTHQPQRSHFQVGRDKDNELMIEDGSVSRHHAFLTAQGEQVFVHDLNSANGTYIDGQPVLFGIWKPRQILRIGAVDCTLEITEEVRQPQPTTSMSFEELVSATHVIPGSVLEKARNIHDRKDIADQPLDAPPSSLDDWNQAHPSGYAPEPSEADIAALQTATSAFPNASNGTPPTGDSAGDNHLAISFDNSNGANISVDITQAPSVPAQVNGGIPNPTQEPPRERVAPPRQQIPPGMGTPQVSAAANGFPSMTADISAIPSQSNGINGHNGNGHAQANGIPNGHNGHDVSPAMSTNGVNVVPGQAAAPVALPNGSVSMVDPIVDSAVKTAPIQIPTQLGQAPAAAPEPIVDNGNGTVTVPNPRRHPTTRYVDDQSSIPGLSNSANRAAGRVHH